MLKNIDPRLTPELLYVLAAMGHGDDLAIVDANFPAFSTARRTCHGRAVPMAGTSMPEVLEAVLSLLPLDDFVDAPVRTMAADGPGVDGLPDVQQEAQSVIDTVAGRHWPMGALDRFAFYEAARNCYAVVLTGEPRFFGNVIIKKGAIPPPG